MTLSYLLLVARQTIRKNLFFATIVQKGLLSISTQKIIRITTLHLAVLNSILHSKSTKTVPQIQIQCTTKCASTYLCVQSLDFLRILNRI